MARAGTRPAGIKETSPLYHWGFSSNDFFLLALSLAFQAFLGQTLPPHPLCTATSSPAVPHTLRRLSMSGSGSGCGSCAGYIFAGLHHPFFFQKSLVPSKLGIKIISFIISLWLHIPSCLPPELGSVLQCLLNLQIPSSVEGLNLSG